MPDSSGSVGAAAPAHASRSAARWSAWPITRCLHAGLFALGLAGLLIAGLGCERVEGTGRSQFILMPDSQMNALGVQAYREVLGKEKRAHDPQAQALLERVGRRLAATAPDRGFQYEFTLLESDQINAFCLPGGKVAVYTAILPYCANEAGLAAVLGHEIAHAIARHGAERMSQGLAIATGQATLGALLQHHGVDDSTTNLALGAFGLGSQIGVLLPFSRDHEREADYLGLTYLARAGYDPREAIAFWQRFAALDARGGPSFLRTHPLSTERAERLTKAMPEAQALYAKAPTRFGLGEPMPARYRTHSTRP